MDLKFYAYNDGFCHKNVCYVEQHTDTTGKPYLYVYYALPHPLDRNVARFFLDSLNISEIEEVVQLSAAESIIDKAVVNKLGDILGGKFTPKNKR